MNNYSGAFRSALCGLLSALALTVSARSESRGELRYSTHCITCHTSQMHWREKRAATDWTRLKAEVRRWQGAAVLNWSEGDIDEVARYLNESIYRFARTPDPSASLSPPPGSHAQR
jgi:mono/diheme cytochrome c family protein